MPESTVHISQTPSAHPRRLCYDTCVYEPSALSALIAQVGPDHLLMGPLRGGRSDRLRAALPRVQRRRSAGGPRRNGRHAAGIVVLSHRVTRNHVGLTVSDLERQPGGNLVELIRTAGVTARA